MSKKIHEKDAPKFSEAIGLRDNKKFAEALFVIEPLIEKYPGNLKLVMMAAYLHWELGGLDKASCIFRSATKLAPKSEEASLGLFHCLWELGKQVEALDEVKRFMAVSYSQEYMDIVREINSKTCPDSKP